MNRYQRLIVKRASEAPFVKLDKELGTLLRRSFDGSVEGVCASILSGGHNQVGRLAHAFGPKYLNELWVFLKSLKAENKQYEGFDVLYDLTEKAMSYLYEEAGQKRPEETPSTVEQLLKTPMHPDVKNIKSNRK